MKNLKLLGTWLQLPPSRRRQWLGFLRDRILTRHIYARRLKSCGRMTIVQKPLFWTPEFIEIGERVHIWPGARIEGIDNYARSRFNPMLRIGERATLQQNCHITYAGILEIGKGTSIMYGALITDIDHDYIELGTPVIDQQISVSLTRIGCNCFIGAGAKIQAGTVLGDQCIVGANAVVRGTFPDHSVIAGVPARIVKRRDSETGEWRKTDQTGAFLP